MWLSTHYFCGFLQDWFHVFLYEIKKNSVWYNFYQGTSVSITFYIFEHYQLWMMDSKGQRVFFPKTPQLCVWHTEVRSCYHFKLVSHFQLWFPIWGVLVNRLRFRGWRLATRTFSSLHRFPIGFRSGDWLGHSRTLMCFFLSHSFVALAVCFGSFSWCWNTHPQPIFNALALTVHSPIHLPFDAVQLSCPLSRKTEKPENPQSIMQKSPKA